MSSFDDDTTAQYKYELDEGTATRPAIGPDDETGIGESDVPISRSTLRPAAIQQLAALSTRVLLILAAAGAIGIVLVVVVLVIPDIDTSAQALLGAVLAGFVGACVAASVSVAQRRADGWEFEDGSQWPETHADKERFNAAMVPFFYLRPFLGAALGLFAYGAVVGGVVFTTGRPIDLEELQPTAMVAFGFLAGLFSKTLIEKLREGFDAFLSGG